MVALAVVGAPASAAAGPVKTLHPTTVARASGGATSDGVRYAGYLATPRRLVILDTRRHRTVKTRLPPACGHSFVPDVAPPFAPPRLAGIAAGMALVSCASPNFPNAELFDIATRTWRTAAGLPGLFDERLGHDETYGWEAVGARWLQADIEGYHFEYPEYLQWRSGERRRLKPTRTEVVDLDRPGLVRRLCDPLRVPSNPAEDTYNTEPRFNPTFLSAGRAAVWDPGRVTGRRRLDLQRCGSHRVVHPAPGTGLQLSPRWLSWMPTAGGVRVISVVGPRRYRIAVPRGDSLDGAVHTANRVFVSRVVRNGGRTTITGARLPGPGR